MALWRMNIIVYYKDGCPWAAAVMGLLRKLKLPYEPRNLSAHEEFARECQEKSGQTKSPTLDIDGEIVADAGVDEVAEYLEKHGVAV